MTTEYQMTFWRGNRIDAEFTKSIGELVEEFMASTYASELMPLDRALRLFLTDPDGPVGGVWVDDTGYSILINKILDKRDES